MTKKIERPPLLSAASRPVKSRVSQPADPISRTAMRVRILEIDLYDKNPRTVRNESYDEIKESIREKGIEQPFTITRRPGDLNYTTRAGGNTRLAIIKELYAETKDERYLFADVFFEPYTKEQDLLISHLTENDLRGNLTLLDRAKGVSQARDMIESELGRKLSLRDLSSELKANGYSLGHTILGVLLYALDELYPALPDLLDNGAGKSVVERVRKLEGQLKEVWNKIEQNQDAFKPIFNEALKEAYKHSEPGLENDEILRAFEAEAALETGVDIYRIRIAIDEVIHKVGTFKPAAFKTEDVEQNTNASPFELSESPEATEENPEDLMFDEDLNPAAMDVKRESKQPYPTNNPKPPSLLSEEEDSESELSEPANQTHPMDEQDIFDITGDLAVLRATALKLAICLAKEADIEDLVIKTHQGFGWALADMPQEIHFTQCGIDDSQPQFRKIWQVWYALYLLSGASIDNQKKRYATFIAHENDLKALVEERFEAISDLGQYVTTASLTHALPILANESFFTQLHQLQVLTRKMYAKDNELWEVSRG